MIGFKTIDDYSFDDCLVFLTEHDKYDPSWEEINQRYRRLYSQLQKEDEFAFGMCSTSQDYKNYLEHFRNINGATKYQPLHENEAQNFFKINPVPETSVRELYPEYKFIKSSKLLISLRSNIIAGFISFALIIGIIVYSLCYVIDIDLKGLILSCLGIFLLMDVFMVFKFYIQLIKFSKISPKVTFIQDSKINFWKTRKYLIFINADNHWGLADWTYYVIIPAKYDSLRWSKEVIVATKNGEVSDIKINQK